MTNQRDQQVHNKDEEGQDQDYHGRRRHEAMIVARHLYQQESSQSDSTTALVQEELPAVIQQKLGHIGYGMFYGRWYPVLLVSPWDCLLPPAVRNAWQQSLDEFYRGQAEPKHVGFWIGTDQECSLLRSDEFVPLEHTTPAQTLEYDKLAVVLKKDTEYPVQKGSLDEYLLDAVQQMKDLVPLAPAQRRQRIREIMGTGSTTTSSSSTITTAAATTAMKDYDLTTWLKLCETPKLLLQAHKNTNANNVVQPAPLQRPPPDNTRPKHTVPPDENTPASPPPPQLPSENTRPDEKAPVVPPPPPPPPPRENTCTKRPAPDENTAGVPSKATSHILPKYPKKQRRQEHTTVRTTINQETNDGCGGTTSTTTTTKKAVPQTKQQVEESFRNSEKTILKTVESLRMACPKRGTDKLLRQLTQLQAHVPHMCWQFIVHYQVGKVLTPAKKLLKSRGKSLDIISKLKQTIQTRYNQSKEEYPAELDFLVALRNNQAREGSTPTTGTTTSTATSTTTTAPARSPKVRVMPPFQPSRGTTTFIVPPSQQSLPRRNRVQPMGGVATNKNNRHHQSNKKNNINDEAAMRAWLRGLNIPSSTADQLLQHGARRILDVKVLVQHCPDVLAAFPAVDRWKLQNAINPQQQQRSHRSKDASEIH